MVYIYEDDDIHFVYLNFCIMSSKMDFHSVMESFAEAWVVANTHTPLTEAAEQGLINGPNNNHGASNQNQANHVPPPATVIQDPSKEDNVPVTENSRTPDQQTVVDTPAVCLPNNEFRPKIQETHGKCLPVHCIVEQVPGPQACGQYVELDSYAIVPTDTLFSDLVRTALGKLGYSASQIVGAKGSIQIKKWKPLAFDQVTENPEATVVDILGDLTTMASLHIRLYSVPDNPQEWKDITVRNAVLELLREMSQIKLAKLCPLSQPMLSNIINNRYSGKIGKEKCQEFGTWYLNYRKQNPEGSAPEIVPNERPIDGRLTFHPTKELPIMRDWFHNCRSPSRRTLQMYVDILNQGPVRQQERPKIVLSTLKNWWKNEKQRERKHSDDKFPEAIKAKRKKKFDISSLQKEALVDNNLQQIASPSSDEAMKANNFTLINHSENESDHERFSRRDSEASESSLVDSNHHFPKSSILEASKSSSKFSFVNPNSHEMDIERLNRKEGELSENRLNGQVTEPSKEILPIESPYFPRLHTVCIDPNMHSLFNFADHPLSIPPPSKVFCDNSLRTNVVENNNSHMSSEEDVDVGI